MSNNFDWGKDLPPSQRDAIQKLVDSGRILPMEVNGNVSPIWDYLIRPVVMVKYGDTHLPFYISSGLGGKKNVETGKWYPFAGIGIDTDWLNKGTTDQINNYYDDPVLKTIANQLDSEIGNVDTRHLPRVPFDSMQFPKKINELIGVGPALEHYGDYGDLNDPSTGTKGRVTRRFANIMYKARGFKNLPYPNIIENKTSDLFNEEYKTKTGRDLSTSVNNISSKKDAPFKFTGKFTKLTQSKKLIINPDKVHSGIDSEKQSGVNANLNVKEQHIKVHGELEKNSIKNFFSDKVEIKSFDTETTGLDTDSKDFSKRARIYELGLANSGIDGVEEHVNPFFIFNKDKKPTQEVLSKQSAETRLKLMNGGFSLKAHQKGNFNELLNKFPLQLEPLDETLNKMFENVKSKDVIVLQNMNFENKILKSSYDQGLISKETYEGIANRMNTVSLDKKGDLLHLFERPASVQEKMREADMIFNTEYLFNRSEESFQKYRTLLNESMEIYKSVINDPNRSGAVAVELMDVTKTFMANAADKGFLSKEASTLGLNMDFLMQAMSLGEESHTALQDAKDTITVYNKLLTANQELLDNNISDETKTLLTRITESQPKEVNRKFISTVRSILSDFNIKGNTKLTDRYSWYSPEVNLREGNDYNIKLDQVVTKRKQTTTNLNDALLNALERYSVYNDNLDGFNRKEYVDNLLKNNTSTTSMYSQVDSDYFKGVGSLSNNNGMTPTDVPLINNKQSPTISEDIKSKLSKKQLGLGILGAGLAYMAFQSRPEPVEKNYDNVSQQFYDDQYLGTAFVDFRERNKHYMM